MCLKVLQTLLIYVFVYVLAFEDIFVQGQDSLEMIEQGRTQYQLLREKGNLPRYGSCWKGAIEHVEEGCKNLSEETQSDMALHITNCFLDMSGHETYNCELDKKANLRSICINSMSDRAFNVYTEFYTHVQNICWFLRGQIWYETISENSLKVGKQLEMSARNQKELLESQRESIQMQENILKHERLLEEVMADLYVSTKAHQEILRILTKSVASFQTWVIGEVSWLDSVIFYTVSGLFTLLFTSIKRTANARLPLFLLLFTNFISERLICFILVSNDTIIDTNLLYQDIYTYIWYCRNFFIILIIFYLIYHSYNFKDLVLENHKYLQTISWQNSKIMEMLHSLNNNFKDKDKIKLINENSLNGFCKKTQFDSDESTTSSFSERIKSRRINSLRTPLSFIDGNGRYNLRSKQNTPDL